MESFWEEEISVNSFQLTAMFLKCKIKVLLAGRGTGKSYVNGADLDENIRTMPRGITSNTQKTLGQALTKTLPSTFKFLEYLGYEKYNPRTKRGDYVVCQKPPSSFYTPLEKLMNFDYVISFSNGHAVYILSQEAGARGPNVDYNISDEALTLDKVKYDQEASATNRGNEEVFGFKCSVPVFKHHGSTFTSSMCYTPEQKWLAEFGSYYQKEAGIRIFEVWNKIVNIQLQLIKAKIDKDETAAVELYKESIRLRRLITPFVSKDGVLFMLANAFDNLHNVGMSYIINQYKTMDLLTFMIEMLNYYIEKVTDCYYAIDERHVYYNADNSDFIRGLADDNNFNWKELRKRDCRYDADCSLSMPLEITPDWGSKISLIEVGQERTFDFVTKTVGVACDNTINEFFVKPAEESEDTMINLLIDRFCDYYRFHHTKDVIFTVDTYGDIKLANSTKTYNEHAISRLKRNKWNVTVRRHPGKEPPQAKKWLMWQYMLKETDPRFPKKRFNGSNCKYTLISMNNTSVLDSISGKIEKDKRSEARSSVLPEEATHFGDAVDKRMWTKYGYLLDTNLHSFVDNKI